MSSRPNVLFVVVDDLRPQLGCYGVDWIQSPNIDSLAEDGLLFERAYCQQAICGPSRCSVLSGCRPDTLGIFDLKTRLRDVDDELLTLPLAFKNAGYETLSVGKVYHHQNDDPQGWSKPAYQTKGDWQGRGYLTDEAIEAMKEYAPVRAARGDTRPGVGPAFEAADVDDEAYHDGKDATACIEELQRLAKQDTPFFMAMGFHKPHLPFIAPRRYWDLYDEAAVPLALNPYPPEGATPYSLTDYGELRGYFGMPREGPIPEDLARKLVHGYAACVSYMDAQFGRVLQALDELELRDNTVIVLWGDHGWKLGEHGSWCKHTNFEIDTRAPLILGTPDTRSDGLRTSALVEFIDIFPTLCDLCGVKIPETCEGTSLRPLLDDPQRPWDKPAISLYPRGGNVMGYTLRTDRYRYTEWIDLATRAAKARELYDHEKDPGEDVNAVNHSEYGGTVAALSAQLRRHTLGGTT